MGLLSCPLCREYVTTKGPCRKCRNRGRTTDDTAAELVMDEFRRAANGEPAQRWRRTAAELAEILPDIIWFRTWANVWEGRCNGEKVAECCQVEIRLWSAWAKYKGYLGYGCTQPQALRRSIAAERVSRGQADPNVAALFCVGVALVEWLVLLGNGPPEGIRGLLGPSVDAMVDRWEQEVYDRTMILKTL